MVDARVVHRAAGNTEQSACRILQSLAADVPSKHAIVELGAYKGRTTGWLSFGAERGHGAPLFSVDPWEQRSVESWPGGYADRVPKYSDPSTREAFEAHVQAARIRTTVTQATAVDAAAIYDGPPVGLLYHDAEHTHAAVVADLEAWMPHLAERCTVALHDAGNPKFGSFSGAQEVLPQHGFDWGRLQLTRWRKHPDRRGLLVVTR